MYQLYYQPEGIWVGDIMPYGKEGQFYVYHQRDTRNPGPFGEPFGWALATTKDFVDYKDYGESLMRGTDEEADQFIYAGSVFETEAGFHAFYTGYNREFLKAGKTSQTLLHATSKDGITWEKSKEALEIPPQEGYDKRNWRDPFVLWDEEREEYLLILGARKGEDKRKQTGRLVHFTSKDLKKWEFKGDFWAPGIYTMFEMPEIFKMGDWWYLVFSEYSEGNKIHYRRARTYTGLGKHHLMMHLTVEHTMQDVQHLMENEEYFLDGCQQESITMTRTHTCGEELSCHTKYSRKKMEHLG